MYMYNCMFHSSFNICHPLEVIIETMNAQPNFLRASKSSMLRQSLFMQDEVDS